MQMRVMLEQRHPHIFNLIRSLSRSKTTYVTLTLDAEHRPDNDQSPVCLHCEQVRPIARTVHSHWNQQGPRRRLFLGRRPC